MTTSEQYRVTSWPTNRLPVPAVPCFPVALAYATIAVDWETEGQSGDTWHEELPDELYLRELRDLDLYDEVELAHFLGRYGWFCKPDWRSLPARFTHSGGLVQNLRPEVLRGLSQRFSHEGEQLGPLHPYLAAIDGLIVLVNAEIRTRGASVIWESTNAYRGLIHVGELRVHAEFLRNAVLVWDALSSGHGLKDLPDRWEGPFGLPQLLAQGWPLDEAAPLFLQETLNAALADFHVRLLISAPDAELGEPEVTTYEAMALQLFNDVAAKTPYQRCANEKCGRLFLRQRGRAKYGQHRRLGTIYCSEKCLNAKKQRNFNERERAKKRAAKDSS